ncbi:MAG: DegV family EDD domain-containing protein, partial [Desulfobacterales bacterium]|nr:DegV family EDD domain-containing protein [Desulfobacterales bacterium]
RHRAAGVLAELLDVGVVMVMAAQPAAAPAAPLPDAPAPLPDAPDMEKSLLKGLNNIDRRKLTGILEIRDRPVKSTIYFDNGRIVHAYHGMTTSKKALFRIFSEKGGLKRFQPQPVVVENTIDASLGELIAEWLEENAWLRGLDEDVLNDSIRLNPGMLEKLPKLKKRPVFLNIISLVQQHGKIRDIIDASSLPDLKTYKCLLYLAKLKIIAFEALPRVKTRIITDSTADLPPGIARDRNIIVAPISLTMNGKVYRDGIDIRPRDFYELLENSDSFPTTSPLSVEDCHELFSEISRDSDILAIFLSKKLSLTYEHAVAAKSTHYEEYAGRRAKRHGGEQRPRIEILDSELVSLSLGHLVLEAADKIEEGWPADRVRAHLEGLLPRFRTFFLVNTLEYLKRGGKVGKFKAMMGNFLGIRPILAIKNGEIVMADQVRGGKKGQKRIEKLVEEELESFNPDTPIRVGVMHGNAPKWAEQMRDIIDKRFNCEKILVSSVGPAAGAHCGPGVVAVTILPLVAGE